MIICITLKYLLVLAFAALFISPAARAAQADWAVSVDPPGAVAASWEAQWNTAGDFEGWTTTQFNASVADGVLTGMTTGSEASVQRTDIANGPDLDLGYNDFLEMRIQVPASYEGPIEIHYGTTDASGFDLTRRIEIPADRVADDGAFHTYRIELGLEVLWRSSLRDLRIVPLVGPGSDGMNFAIDHIRIGDEPGATV